MHKSDLQLLKRGLISRYVYLFWWIDPKTEASNLQQFVKRNGLMFKEQPIKFWPVCKHLLCIERISAGIESALKIVVFESV